MKKKYIKPQVEVVLTVPTKKFAFTIASDPNDPSLAESKRRSSFIDDEEEEEDDDYNSGDNYWK